MRRMALPVSLFLGLTVLLAASGPVYLEAAALEPNEVAALFRQLDDKDAGTRKAAVEKILGTGDTSLTARLKRTLQNKSGMLIRKAISERSRALRAALSGSRKDFSSQAFAARQQKALALFKAGKTKELEPLVKSMWKDFFFDPAVADADEKAAAAVARVKEIDGYLRMAGAEEKDLPAAKMKEKLDALDESCAMRVVPPRDQQVLMKNAALRSQIPAEEYKLICMTNQYRILMGKPVLKLDAKLCAAAREHSKDMVERKFFSHDSPLPGKRRPADRARRHGTTASAENIAMGGAEADRPFWMWFHSMGHHENMLGSYATLGVGNHGKHWTEMFG